MSSCAEHSAAKPAAAADPGEADPGVGVASEADFGARLPGRGRGSPRHDPAAKLANAARPQLPGPPGARALEHKATNQTT